jgi:hypothetical protein
VVLLRPKELAKVQGKPGWFEISELMRAWLKANVPDQALLQHSAAYSFVQSDRVARFLLRNETFFAPYPKVNDAIQLCQSIAKPADDDERMKDGAKVFSEFVGLARLRHQDRQRQRSWTRSRPSSPSTRSSPMWLSMAPVGEP